jgi:ribosome-associated protein
MDIRKLQRAIVDGLEDVKGQHIVVFNTEHLSPLFERVIIASGTSNRQTKALAASVRDAVKARGFGPPRTEGEENGEWIIVDCGAAVVHLMQPGIREYYHLEEIWGDKLVRLKLDTASPRLVKASEPLPAVKKATPTKKAARSEPPARKVVAKKAAAPAARKHAARKPTAATAPQKKTARRAAPAAKVPARKIAPTRKAVTRTVGVKTSAKRPATAKTSPARRAPSAKAASQAGKALRRKT